MKGIKVLLLGAVFCAAVAPYVYAWSGVQNRICSHADVGNSPVEMITFEQSGIRIVSSGTIPTELSNSRFGIPVSTATWEESLSGYKTYPGKIEYQKHSVLNFYNANGKRIKAVKKAEIIARMHKKAGAETTVSSPEFSVNISTAGYVAFRDTDDISRFSAVGLYNGLGEELFSDSIESFPNKLEEGKYYAQWGPALEISGDGNFIGIARGYGDKRSLDPNEEMNDGYRMNVSLVILNRKGQFVREIFYKNASAVACPTLSWSGRYGMVKGVGGGRLCFLMLKRHILLL